MTLIDASWEKKKKSSNREGSMVVGEVDSTDSMNIHYWKIDSSLL